MLKVLVDYEKIFDLYNEDVLQGSRGFCIIRDKVIKKFYFHGKDEKDIVDLSMFKSDYISFPKYYLYNKDCQSEVVGEVMPYYDKRRIDWIMDKNSSIELFIKNYEKIIKEMKSFLEVKMIDVFCPNILYNEKTGFSLIDTMEWKVKSNGNFYKYNKGHLDYEITCLLVLNLLGITSFVIRDPEFVSKLRKYNSGKKLLELLYSFFDEDKCVFLKIIDLYQNILE